MFLRLVFNENPNQIVHTLVFVLLSVLVYIEFLTQEAIPILLKFCFGGFANHLTLNLGRVFVIGHKEAFNTATSSEVTRW